MSSGMEVPTRSIYYVILRLLESLQMDIISLSQALGWGYVVCWSASFIPQLILNEKRRSVHGLSLDFVCLNVFGFLSYFLFNISLYCSESIREAYVERFAHLPNLYASDIAFSLNALVMTSLCAYQCVIYRKSIVSNVTTATRLFIIICTLISVLSLLVSSLLDFIYFLSLIKLSVTLIKYVPQVRSNYESQSTEGFSRWNIFLDFAGGLLALTQLALDCWLSNDITTITGNPVKFALALISITFDLIFMYQFNLYSYELLPSHNQRVML